MGDAIHDISSGSPALLAGCAFGLVALLLGHILNSSTNRTTWTLAGTGVGARALTPHRQTAPVAQAAIAAQVHQPFNAHGHLAPQISFHPDLVDRLPQLFLLAFGQIPDFGVRSHTGCAAYLKSAAAPDSVNMSQSHPDMLLYGQVDACYSCHSITPKLVVLAQHKPAILADCDAYAKDQYKPAISPGAACALDHCR